MWIILGFFQQERSMTWPLDGQTAWCAKVHSCGMRALLKSISKEQSEREILPAGRTLSHSPDYSLCLEGGTKHVRVRGCICWKHYIGNEKDAFKNLFQCLFLKGRGTVWAGEGQRGRETESKAGSRLRAVSTEPGAGLELTSREITHLTEPLRHPQRTCFLNLF